MTSRAKEIEKKQEQLVLNPGSERNLISICLQNPDKIIDVVDENITADHFNVSGNRFIFMAIMYLYQKQIEPSPLAILEVLNTEQARKAVDDLGGLDYLLLLKENQVSASNLKIFIDKVKQSYTRVNLIDIAGQIKDFALSEQAEVLNPKELISYGEEKLSNLSTDSTVSKEVYRMGTNTDEVLSQRMETPSHIPGLESGMPEFDNVTGGGRGGDLIVFCAPSKTGKSVLLTNIATKLAVKDKIPVVYFDTEMNEREQEDRILANLTGIPQNEIVSGLYALDTENGTKEEKMKKLIKAKQELAESEYYHVYMPQFDMLSVMALAKRFVLQYGVKAIFFDYIKIPSSQANFKSTQEYQALGYMTSSLKEMAGILNVPVYTACQTNRDDLEGADPDAGNIGGSYRILQLATKLIFLYNKTDEKIAKDGIYAGNQQLFVKYQRNGMSDCKPINLMFHRKILRQEEV